MQLELEDFRKFLHLDSSCSSGLRWNDSFPFFGYFDSYKGYLIAQTKRCGKPAGSLASHGYMTFSIFGRNYKTHRVVFMLYNGIDLEEDQIIDHKNGCTSDNDPANLRIATMSQNGANSKLSAKNTSGYKGVYCHVTETGYIRFHAYIKKNYKRTHIGVFNTAEEAYNARRMVAKQLQGKFARHK